MLQFKLSLDRCSCFSQAVSLACLCDVQWSAPEVLAGCEAGGRVVTPKSDVYMLGGLVHELLTSGEAPFHWLAGNPQLLLQRLSTDDPVEIPGAGAVPGLLHTNVLRAATLGGVQIPWRIRSRSPACLQRLKEVMSQCLEREAHARPTLAALRDSVIELQREEAAADADYR